MIDFIMKLGNMLTMTDYPDWEIIRIPDGYILKLDGDNIFMTKAEEKDNRIIVETQVFSHNPNKIYTICRCPHCGEIVRSQNFPRDMWNDYLKDKYDPDIYPYCHNCGGKLEKENENGLEF